MLVNSNSDLIRLINNGIKNDLASRNPTFMNLALHCIANVGSREMAEAFASDIPGILVAGFVLFLHLRCTESVSLAQDKSIWFACFKCILKTTTRKFSITSCTESAKHERIV